MDPNYENLGRLPREKKVEIMMDMTNAAVEACMEGIRAQNPDITERELVEKVRERLEWRKRGEL